MNLFFDTSALVKFFHEEQGTERVTELITNPGNDIWVLEIARLEFASALHRRYRNKEIDEKKLEVAIAAFDSQQASFNIEPLGHAVVEEANAIINEYGKSHGLRTLDALHLGAFNLISENDWILVAADLGLTKAAEAIGFKTINPLA